MFRKIFSAIVSLIATAFLVPFIQTPAAKLAEQVGFDTLLADRWRPTMAFLSSLAANPLYIFAAGATVGLAIGLWLGALLKRRETTKSMGLLRKTREFSNETICLADIVDPGAPVLSGRKFTRCRIVGPGYLKLQDHVTMLLCSVPSPKVFLTVPEGGAAMGALFLANMMFEHCYFEHITFLGTPDDMKILMPALDVVSVDEWKERINR
jgi:hypothetical protein